MKWGSFKRGLELLERGSGLIEGRFRADPPENFMAFLYIGSPCFVGVGIRALIFGLHIRGLDCWKLRATL